MWTPVFSIFSVSSFHVVCAPSVREMKHVCPFNVSNIELYYILYICLYPSYTHIDQRRCVTRKFYTLIFILLFFFGKKKIIKCFLLNKWYFFQWEEGGTDGACPSQCCHCAEAAGGVGGGSAPAWLQQPGCSWDTSVLGSPQAFGLSMTRPWVALMCSGWCFWGRAGQTLAHPTEETAVSTATAPSPA